MLGENLSLFVAHLRVGALRNIVTIVTPDYSSFTAQSSAPWRQAAQPGRIAATPTLATTKVPGTATTVCLVPTITAAAAGESPPPSADCATLRLRPLCLDVWLAHLPMLPCLCCRHANHAVAQRQRQPRRRSRRPRVHMCHPSPQIVRHEGRRASLGRRQAWPLAGSRRAGVQASKRSAHERGAVPCMLLCPFLPPAASPSFQAPFGLPVKLLSCVPAGQGV